jgi:PST family polysaccharide transporter
MTQRSDDRAPGDAFGADVSTEDLKTRSVRGGATTMVAQGLTYVIDLAGLVVLARLLAPQDFGLLAMVTAVMGFLAMFKDAGLPTATLQRATIDEHQVSALFWINAALSLVLAILVAAISGPVAWFYGDARLQSIMLVLGVSFVFMGLEAQHAALLRRRMRFGALAWSRTLAQASGTAAAVAAAWAGFGYWALVVRGLVTPLVSMLAVWMAMPWLPGAPWKARGARSLVQFGGYVTAFSAVNHLGRNLDDILIGRFFGGAALGLYSKAYALLLMPINMINGPISGVALPALCRLRDDPARLRHYYARALTMVVTLSMPVVTCLAALTTPFVAVVLGERWTEVGELFRILAIPAFVGTFNVASGWVFVAMGRVREQLIAGTVNSSVNAVAIVIGLSWGVEGVAWALATTSILKRLPTLAYCYRDTPFRLRDLGDVLWRPALAAIGAGLVTHAFALWLTPHTTSFFVLIASLPVFAAFYLAGLLGLPGGRSLVAEVVGHLRLLRSDPREVPA